MKTQHPTVFAAVGLLSTFLVSGILAQQGNRPPAGPPPKLTKVRDSLYVLENQAATLADLGAYGGNLTIYLTDQGPILVDSKFERNHDDVVSKIKSLTDKPVKYLILTHNHQDHAGGAAKLEADGAQVIISSEDRENLVKAPNQSWLPALTYSGQADIFLGGKHVQLLETRGHTRGDTIVYFPAERVVCAGDLVTVPWDDIPLIVNYGDGGNWTDWGHSINKLLAMDWDVLIPGHGPAINRQKAHLTS